ncbi:Uncharacterised protein [Mycobacteroides abscessus subsp. abscessus]|uniref:Lipoprotein n=1 Tax=Mycobacteroides abscessus subsp. bolletii TaxID=319705 RepID=A0A9Q7SHJ7_9MYCO|nr:hypothetical protein [Mycobacteroides abscessus]SHU55513.1 Uncharacterised protein [Mycobacteroides abscessus subsp. bolletii]SHU73666.1 Uncharacterised protein [Mycobacteroides abscessus subsp. bolletii]SHX83462.1 Uncharacterised protein [Mycobacteroides abscessus subsp. bolletii]SID82401.1 Uncharacterised protein [Mycobacteroides abscessus subsp. abscessus]SIF85523.1 Uncharacterised protein [Mycobacteroides abscessus subsp. abscessus]
MKSLAVVLVTLPLLAGCSTAEAAEAEHARCERVAAAAPAKFASVRVPLEVAVRGGVPAIVRVGDQQFLAAGELLGDAEPCEITGLSEAWHLDLRGWGQPPPPTQ